MTPMENRLVLITIIVNCVIGCLTVIWKPFFDELYIVSGMNMWYSTISALIIIWGLGGYITVALILDWKKDMELSK